jgi:hypothetical protein
VLDPSGCSFGGAVDHDRGATDRQHGERGLDAAETGDLSLRRTLQHPSKARS